MYGKLTVDQLREYVKLERQAGPFMDAVFAEIRGDKELICKFGKDLLPWFEAYEGPIIDQIALLYRAYGLTPLLEQAAASKNPHGALLELAEKSIPDESINSDAASDAVIKAFGIVMGIAKNIDSLRVFGKYINELVAEGKAGNDKSYFDAIRIDPTVVGCDSFACRLSRAVLEDDNIFLGHLRLALMGKTKKHQSQLNRVRVAVRFLIDAGADKLPDDQLYDLFVQKLKIYSPGEDGAKALRKHISKQRSSTTQKRKK